ncbi:D-altritol 5-dehydrogenase-like [Bacillus rossius redtenbacheri]|uniref:D-altritol 5-dehydrogenase-like n=1 Tax=Bacillus rossius redtenbacheri TaxID=93214 RepID=UPI002FDDAE50
MSGSMKAVQWDARSSQLQLQQLPVPAPPDDHVLVKVAYSGICGTDLHVIEGSFPAKKTAPVTLGHEFSGVVQAVGSKVTSIKVGDRVAVDPNNGCNKCKVCHDGNYHFCETGGINNTIGLWRNGGWAEFCLAPESQVLKLPDTITLKQASLMEPLSCLCHGLDVIGPMPVGSAILIQGAGIIGNLWACALHHQGHRKVIVSEPSEARRKALHKLDTGYEIVSPGELGQKGRDPGWGVDFVIDCSGHAPAIEEAVSLLSCGGTLCIFGVAPPDARISVSPYHLYKKEIKIVSVNISPYTSNKAIGLIEAMGDRYLGFDRIGVKIFPLSQYEDAIAELRKGGIAKAMFEVNKIS